MTPRIHDLLANPLSGENIEALSFATIDREAPPHNFSRDEWEVVRRVIHTTGDFSVMGAIRFSKGAIQAGIDALKNGHPIFTDANMIRSGLSLPRLRSVWDSYGTAHIHCYVRDDDVAGDAAKLGLPRSVLAMQKAKPILMKGGIAVFGNAPTALLELNRMIIEEGARPALIIAAPVGFVHVEESKEELLGLDIPHIVLSGRRGGSPIAVAIVHALCTLALRKENQADGKEDFDTVLLLGHGSRVPEADGSMLEVAEALRNTDRYNRVATCNMSCLGPSFEEVFETCVSQGSRKILLLPYFLNQGLHMKLDIPEMMQAAVGRHPEVTLVFGKNLGFDSLLVRLVEKRIRESLSLADVREVLLRDKG